VTFPSVCLVVLDGWGLAPDGPGNAVSLADTPVMDRLWASYPHARLRTSGEDVGLPPGQMGNSEVGHLNLGAGAVVRQDLKRIDDAVADGSFARNEVLVAAMEDAPRVHLIGLVSDGGVHSSLEHLEALIGMARERGVPDLVIHAFTDGRDTSPTAGAGYVERVESAGFGRVGTVMGRYFAMDRDRRAERTQKAFDAMVRAQADYTATDGVSAVRAAYERDETDEFIEPTLVGEEARIRAGDSVIGWLRTLIGLFVLGLLFILLAPRFGRRTVGTLGGSPWASLGLGIALLICVPIAALIVFVVGLFVGGWWLALILLALYGVALVLSVAVAGLFLGRWILERVGRGPVPLVWALLLGLVLLLLVSLVPVAGGLVMAVAMFCGLGALALTAARSSGIPPATVDRVDRAPALSGSTG